MALSVTLSLQKNPRPLAGTMILRSPDFPPAGVTRPAIARLKWKANHTPPTLKLSMKLKTRIINDFSEKSLVHRPKLERQTDRVEERLHRCRREIGNRSANRLLFEAVLRHI